MRAVNRVAGKHWAELMREVPAIEKEITACPEKLLNEVEGV